MIYLLTTAMECPVIVAYIAYQLKKAIKAYSLVEYTQFASTY